MLASGCATSIEGTPDFGNVSPGSYLFLPDASRPEAFGAVNCDKQLPGSHVAFFIIGMAGYLPEPGTAVASLGYTNISPKKFDDPATIRFLGGVTVYEIGDEKFVVASSNKPSETLAFGNPTFDDTIDLPGKYSVKFNVTMQPAPGSVSGSMQCVLDSEVAHNNYET